MKQFLYIALFCGVIAGVGIFFNFPHYPTLFLPRLLAMIGLISAIITFKDKDMSTSLNLGSVLINLLPLIGSLLMFK